MRKTVFGAATIALLIGLAIGTLISGGPRNASRPANAVATSQGVVPTIPVECRSALELAGQGFGVALGGFGQARAAANANVGPGGQSPVVGVLGQADARMQSFVEQFNHARAACTAITEKK